MSDGAGGIPKLSEVNGISEALPSWRKVHSTRHLAEQAPIQFHQVTIHRSYKEIQRLDLFAPSFFWPTYLLNRDVH